jgi:hypothetical protein
MSSYPYLTPLKDYLGNIVDGCFNLDSSQRFNCFAGNNDAFAITKPTKPYNVMGVCTTCGDLWCSMTTSLTSAPAAPPTLPATLSTLQSDRFMIPDREHLYWYYVPEDVVTLNFFCVRQGSFMAVFVQGPEQMQDKP